jgi:hypothetical protein
MVNRWTERGGRGRREANIGENRAAGMLANVKGTRDPSNRRNIRVGVRRRKEGRHLKRGTGGA